MMTKRTFTPGLLGVIVLVGAASAQTFAPVPALSFTTVFAGANPLPQVVTITSTGAQFNFSATPSTTTGGAWLQTTPSGVNCCVTAEAVTVSVNATGLTAGTYSGQILFAVYPSGSSMTVPVTLTVAAAGGTFFDDMPGQASFSMLPGGSPPAQTVPIRNGGTGTLNWTATTSTADGGAWIHLSAAAGTAPSLATVSITPASLPGGGLTTGTYIGQLLFHAGANSVTIPVSVTVGTNVFTQVNPLDFTMPFAGSNPLPQVLNLASTGATNFNVSSAVFTGTGGNWLSISNLGTNCCVTPEAIAVTINASTLAAGTYTGEIIFTQYSGRTLAMTVPVTLTVAAPGTTFFDSLPGELSYFLTAGGTAAAQAVPIRNGGSGTLNWTLSSSTADGGHWMTLSALSGTAPATVTVGILTAALPGGGLLAGTYNGQVVLQAGSDLVTIPVSVVVGTNVFTQVNPVSFTMPFAGSDPLPQVLTIPSTGTNFNFSSAVYTGGGGNWLSISNLGTNCCVTPEAITVSIDASTVPAGTYTGEIILTEYSGRTMALTIPVTLAVAAPGAAVFFDSLPGQLSFSLKTGGAAPPSQPIQIRNAGSGTLNWTLSISTADGGNWLSASALSGTAPSTVSVAINPQLLPNFGLIAGTFNGQVVLQAAGNVVTVPVSVVVGANVFAQVNALNFTMPVGGANPLPQTVAIASTGTNFNFSTAVTTGSGDDWLTISNLGTNCCVTPNTITVSVDGSALAAGTYTGEIILTEYSGRTEAMTVPVTLTVEQPGTPFFDNMPGQVSFFLKTGGKLPAQTLQVRNAGAGTLNWTLTASTADGGAWLNKSAASGTAPSTLTVSVVTQNLPGQGLLAGTFDGQLVFQAPGHTVTVPISVVVGDNIFYQENGINFTMPAGGANPLPQILTVPSTGTNFNFSSVVNTGNGGAWLQISNVGANCCVTPEALTVSVNASTLPAGTYTAEIILSEYSGRTMTMTVPVTLTVVAPCSAFFDNVQGQMSFSFAPTSSSPPSQAVQIRNGGSGTLNWSLSATTSDGGNWLTMSASQGTAPSSATIGISNAALPGGGLIAGTFTGELVLRAPTSTVTIQVSVIVGPNVFSQPAAVTFSVPAGGPNPSPQTIQINSTGSNFNFSSAAASAKGGAWLTVSPSGTNCCVTPKTLTATVNATGLPAGTYTGEIYLVEYSGRTMALTVPVILNVTGSHAPVSIVTAGGTPQATTVNTAFHQKLTATVKDTLAFPVACATVTFNAPASGASGTFAGGVNTAVTDVTGLATARTFTANTTQGRYVVTAKVGTVTTNPGFSLTNKPGPPAIITATNGTPQSARVRTAFATNLGASVTDTFGNALSGLTVTFNAPASGASGAFAGGVNTAVTNTQGVATAPVFTANSRAGTYSVTATVAALTTNPGFALTNTAGPAASIAATGGTPQSTLINTPFAQKLQATVKDSLGNPVSGALVTFNAPATGASGTFAGGVQTATTNSQGVATSGTFTANGTAGAYTVTATTGSFTTSPGFSLVNTAAN